MVTAYVALGANLGDAAATLRQAITAINGVPDCSVKKISSLYKTAPLETLPGQDAGGDYINAVVEIETSLPAACSMSCKCCSNVGAGRLVSISTTALM